jgi:hypothetical protein
LDTAKQQSFPVSEHAQSKNLRRAYGHTPLSAAEALPWRCQRLEVGTGAYRRLPVTPCVRREAKRREIELLIVPTARAIEDLQHGMEATNAVLAAPQWRQAQPLSDRQVCPCWSVVLVAGSS